MGVRGRSSTGGITGQWCYERGYGGMGALKWVEEGRVMQRERRKERRVMLRIFGKNPDFLMEL